MQTPNPDTIADAKKCLLTGAWYSCLLRGSARASYRYRCRCLQPTIGLSTGHLGEGLKELKRFATPLGRTAVSTNWTPQSSQVLNHQPKSTHSGTHGSSCICSRGWPSRTSMGGEALGPAKVLCPSLGECHSQEVEVGGLVSMGRRGE